MNKELKSCPFCGGESYMIVDIFNTHPCACYCRECGAKSGNYGTEEEAIAAWNTRYERTCHMVEQPDGYGSYDDVCSECGAFDNGTPYCWNCGAKVVEE